MTTPATLQVIDPPETAAAWRRARIVAWVTLTAAAVLGVTRGLSDDRANAVVRLDWMTVVVLALVGFVGWVVVRFAATYLAGDPYGRRAAHRLGATLAAVAVVVVANDLIVVAVAWSATSLALHGLLAHQGDRPVALAVAHKKFVLARLAELCLVGAIVAFAASLHTTRLDELTARAAAGALPAGAQVGMLLVAVTVVLKCAQLPFHGWLIQVMEAPTPVSALLHAGVVNLGGVVLLRMAGVLDRAPAAQTLLVVVGGLTAVVAAMVMTTRVSVKVSLAWSTCAQMGIMLVQCGLGLWELALLHLVGHSLYKAHAFLRAGSTVSVLNRGRLLGHRRAPRAGEVAAGVLLATGITVGVVAGWSALGWTTSLGAGGWVFVAATALAVANLATGMVQQRHAAWLGWLLVLPVASLVLHEAAVRVAPPGHSAPVALLVLVAVLLVALFVAQTAVTLAPTAAAVVNARRWLFRGLFLDEFFTRVVFAVWPPPSPSPRPAVLPSTASLPVTASQPLDDAAVAAR